MRTEDEYAIKNTKNTVLDSRDCSIEQIEILKSNSPGKDFPVEAVQKAGYQCLENFSGLKFWKGKA